MGESLQKTFIGVTTLALSCIAIELAPVSRQAAYWNRCLHSTLGWINEVLGSQGWDNKAKESLAVGVCNGAVYESKLRIN